MMKNILKSVFILSILISFTYYSRGNQRANAIKADVIIYGGTSAAIIAAVETVQSGKTVVVVSPDIHLGGLSSSGLGYTDMGNKAAIGGLSREFYHRIWLAYSDPAAWKWQKYPGIEKVASNGEAPTMWTFEPHIAEKVFEDFIIENKLMVYRDEWLDRMNGVKMSNGRIVSVTTLSGKTFSGKMFIDATYEGDLMASAGVSYHVGREACSVYNERWNGVQSQAKHHSHLFKTEIDPYKFPGDKTSGLLYGISPGPIAADCTGDQRFRHIVSGCA